MQTLTKIKQGLSLKEVPEFLSVCEYNSRGKPACYQPFKNRHFVGVCLAKMMDHQYEENGARNIYSNYNQMRAYVECSPYR